MSNTAIIILIWTWLIWSIGVLFVGYLLGAYHVLIGKVTRKEKL